MNARQFAAAHMEAEAREKTLRWAKQNKLRPADLARAMAEVCHPDTVEQTIRMCRKRAAYGEWVAWRFKGEEWPDDAMGELARSAAWRRELYEIARKEGGWEFELPDASIREWAAERGL